MVVRLLPVFFTTIMYWTVYAQMGTFFIMQARCCSAQCVSSCWGAGYLAVFSWCWGIWSAVRQADTFARCAHRVHRWSVPCLAESSSFQQPACR